MFRRLEIPTVVSELQAPDYLFNCELNCMHVLKSDFIICDLYMNFMLHKIIHVCVFITHMTCVCLLKLD